MTHPEGGFYSAEDADSVIDPAHPKEKGEGAFYIWSAAEIEASWAPAQIGVRYHYGVEDDGNVHDDPHGEFTGKNILYLRESLDDRDARPRVSSRPKRALLAIAIEARPSASGRQDSHRLEWPDDFGVRQRRADSG